MSRDNTDDRWDDDPEPRRRGGFDRDAARDKVKAPAIGLIVTGALTLLMVVLGAVQYGSLPAQFEAERKKIDENPGMNAQQKEEFKNFMTQYEEAATKGAPVSWVLSGIGSILIIIGAVKMKNLSSSGWGMTSAVLSMIPCFSSCCCVLGLIFGIWAIAALRDPNVRAAIAARGRGADRDAWDDDTGR